MKILIIGGVASGAACAARLRRLDEKAEIVVVEKGEYVSYANCGLPYYVGKTIANKSSLLVMTSERMRRRFNIDVRTNTEAVSINTKDKTIQLKNGDRTYDESYDKLVLATGASPFRPKIDGVDSPLIYTLWSVPDAVKVREIAENVSHVTVIGGGFVGLETAENLIKSGKKVTLVEAADQVMAPLDSEMARLIHNHLYENGVELLLSNGVKSFESTDDKVIVHLSDGKTVDTGLVLLAMGTRPNTGFIRAAGIECDKRGFVLVDEEMKTSVDDIYAAGDIAVTRDVVFDEPVNVPLAGPAAKQGRVIAGNMAHLKGTFAGTQGTSILQIFDLTASCTGASEKRLISKGLKRDVDYTSIMIRTMSHVAFYPGAMPMYIKLIFSCDGKKIFGAQIVGHEGVDKRIDVLATAIRFGASVSDLTSLELAYAPPFGAAKDPVNMAGFVASNVVKGLVRFSDYGVKQEDGVFLDVREDAERQVYSLKDAVSIPLDDLRSRLNELDPAKNYVIFCAIGVRAYNAARILMQNGFEHVSVYPGGVQFYKQMHYEYNRSLENNTINKRNKNMQDNSEKAIIQASQKLDCCGIQCPGPLMKVYEAVQNLKDGESIEVTATDPGFTKDAEAWCKSTGNKLVSISEADKKYIAVIQKGAGTLQNHTGCDVRENADGKTIVVFSGDFDKVMASFIIANGAAAMGRKVSMFFTFWGLTALRKPEKVSVKKSMMEKMFDVMLPRGVSQLGLSRMRTSAAAACAAQRNADLMRFLMTKTEKCTSTPICARDAAVV